MRVAHELFRDFRTPRPARAYANVISPAGEIILCAGIKRISSRRLYRERLMCRDTEHHFFSSLPPLSLPPLRRRVVAAVVPFDLSCYWRRSYFIYIFFCSVMQRLLYSTPRASRFEREWNIKYQGASKSRVEKNKTKKKKNRNEEELLCK